MGRKEVTATAATAATGCAQVGEGRTNSERSQSPESGPVHPLFTLAGLRRHSASKARRLNRSPHVPPRFRLCEVKNLSNCDEVEKCQNVFTLTVFTQELEEDGKNHSERTFLPSSYVECDCFILDRTSRGSSDCPVCSLVGPHACTFQSLTTVGKT